MQYFRLGAVAVVMLALSAAVAYLAMLLVQLSTDFDSKTAALAEQESTNAVLEQTNTVLLTDWAKLETYLEEATGRYSELKPPRTSASSRTWWRRGTGTPASRRTSTG